VSVKQILMERELQRSQGGGRDRDRDSNGSGRGFVAKFPTEAEVRSALMRNACDFCHAKRIKCRDGAPGHRCQQCAARDLDCRFSLKEKTGPKPKHKMLKYSGGGESSSASTSAAVAPAAKRRYIKYPPGTGLLAEDEYDDDDAVGGGSSGGSGGNRRIRSRLPGVDHDEQQEDDRYYSSAPNRNPRKRNRAAGGSSASYDAAAAAVDDYGNERDGVNEMDDGTASEILGNLAVPNRVAQEGIFLKAYLSTVARLLPLCDAKSLQACMLTRKQTAQAAAMLTRPTSRQEPPPDTVRDAELIAALAIGALICNQVVAEHYLVAARNFLAAAVHASDGSLSANAALAPLLCMMAYFWLYKGDIQMKNAYLQQAVQFFVALAPNYTDSTATPTQLRLKLCMEHLDYKRTAVMMAHDQLQLHPRLAALNVVSCVLRDMPVWLNADVGLPLALQYSQHLTECTSAVDTEEGNELPVLVCTSLNTLLLTLLGRHAEAMAVIGHIPVLLQTNPTAIKGMPLVWELSLVAALLAFVLGSGADPSYQSLHRIIEWAQNTTAATQWSCRLPSVECPLQLWASHTCETSSTSIMNVCTVINQLSRCTECGRLPFYTQLREKQRAINAATAAANAANRPIVGDMVDDSINYNDVHQRSAYSHSPLNVGGSSSMHDRAADAIQQQQQQQQQLHDAAAGSTATGDSSSTSSGVKAGGVGRLNKLASLASYLLPVGDEDTAVTTDDTNDTANTGANTASNSTINATSTNSAATAKTTVQSGKQSNVTSSGDSANNADRHTTNSNSNSSSSSNNSSSSSSGGAKQERTDVRTGAGMNNGTVNSSSLVSKGSSSTIAAATVVAPKSDDSDMFYNDDDSSAAKQVTASDHRDSSTKQQQNSGSDSRSCEVASQSTAATQQQSDAQCTAATAAAAATAAVVAATSPTAASSVKCR
jgi:Fungal Zn(2)-Cys(6) binuclear cluster domain